MRFVKSMCWLVSRSLWGCSVLVIVVTLIAVSSAITWTKLPPNPVNGILGENVTLEWNFTLTAAEVFDYFALLRNYIDLAKYSESVGVVIYPPFDANYVRVRNGTSSFVLINLTRDDDGATYCCKVGTKTAGNQGGTIKQECTKLKILVRPAIESFSNNQTVNETGDVTLSCNVSGKPIPSVKWSKADNANDTLSTSSLLRLTNISREQDGFYRCTVDNGLGKVVASVRIIVQYASSIPLPSKKYNFTEGEDMHLECKSHGRPPPIVTWSKRDGQTNITYPPGEQLTIRNANITDKGVYTCLASNGIGEYAIATRTVHVFSQAITWTKEPSNPSFGVLGENVTLEWAYNITSAHKLVQFQLNRLNHRDRYNELVTYRRDGSVTYYIERIKLVKNGAPFFMIITAEAADETEYCCKVLTDKKSLDGKDERCVELKILVRPNITAISRNQTSNETNDVMLSCNATGKPTPEITWTRQGKRDWKHLGSFLPLKKISRDHDGVYWCIARNSVGNATASVTVAVNFRPDIKSFSNNQTVNETGDVTLSCNATGKPVPSVKWSKAENANETLSTSSLLRLTNISREQDGFYRCTADNELGKVVASVRIIVQYRPSETNLTTNAKKNTAIEGLPVTFFCSADSVPPSVYELRFKGLSVDDSSNGIFTIQQVRASHQGTYECTARNILGIGPVATVNLDVLRPPSIDFISHNAAANETDDIMLFCNATGKPPPNITWTSLSEPVPKVVRTGGTLTLSNVTRDQAGTYQCTATNGLMSAKTANVYIKINYAPKRVSINTQPNSAVVALYQRISLYCDADALPYVSSYDWKLNGRTLKRGNQGGLVITQAKLKDAGNYSCLARNRLGSKESAPVAVNVEYQPTVTIFTTGALDNSVVEGTTVTLTCSADGYPAPTYIIRRGVRTLVQQNRTGKHVIRNVQLSAEEEWFFCVPSNKIGNGPAKELKIVVQVAPTFPAQTLPSAKQIRNEGQRANYYCTAEAKPAAVIVWELNGKTLVNLFPYRISAVVIPIPRSKHFRTTGYLIIDKITSREIGNYSCIAINDAGKVSQNTELEVPSSPTESGIESCRQSAGADRQEGDQKGLSVQEVVGIFIAIVFLLLIIGALIAYILWSRKQGQTRNGIGEDQRKNIEDRCSFENEALEMAEGVHFQPDQDDKRHGDEVN